MHPAVIERIILTHLSEIQGYLGKDFVSEPSRAWRNFFIPIANRSSEVYSDVWHQDSHDGNRLLKVFVLLEPVHETDGPLHFLSLTQTRKYWSKVHRRTKAPRQDFHDQNIFTGSCGHYMIIDTSRHMHRAGVPDHHRDMLQVTLYPSWRAGYKGEVRTQWLV